MEFYLYSAAKLKIKSFLCPCPSSLTILDECLILTVSKNCSAAAYYMTNACNVF